MKKHINSTKSCFLYISKRLVYFYKVFTRKVDFILKEVKKMKDFLTAKDIQQILKVKQAKSYEIIRELNREMQKQGYKVIRGRVNKAIFEKAYFYNEEVKTG